MEYHNSIGVPKIETICIDADSLLLATHHSRERAVIAALREDLCPAAMTHFRRPCLLALHRTSPCGVRIAVRFLVLFRKWKIDAGLRKMGHTADVDFECFSCESPILYRHIVFAMSQAVAPQRFYLVLSTKGL